MKNILVTIGPPRSGLKLLSNCLKSLGIKGPETQMDANTIGNLFLQDMGLSPFCVAMPEGWLHTEAGSTAINRICNLLQSNGIIEKDSTQSKGTDTCVSNNLYQLSINNALIMDLWLSAFNELSIKPRFVLMLRHPWETAHSMAANHNLDLQTAHILWFSHIRAALRALEEQDYSLVTYDQLLADPVSNLNAVIGSLLTSDLQPLSSNLLVFVQPSLKNHHVSDLPDSDKKTYEPYARIYNQIRAGQKIEDKDYGITESLLLTLTLTLTQCITQLTKKPSYKLSKSHDPIIMELELTLPDNSQILIPLATNKRQYLRLEDNVLHFSTPDDEPMYLYTKENTDWSIPPKYNLFSLKLDTDYSFSGHFKGKGDIMAWAIEYDLEKRIAHQTDTFVKDHFDINLHTHEQHSKLCFALRLYGRGYLNLNEYSLNISKGKSPAIEIGKRWIHQIVEAEYKQQKFTRFNERPVEFAFVFNKLSKTYPLKVLDVGTGKTALPHIIRNCGHLVSATDNIYDYWPDGMINRHYYVIDDDITDTKISDMFDLITCISVLEHIEIYDRAIANMFSLLNKNGYLIITFPYTEKQYIKNVYELPGSTYGQNVPYITQSFSRAELNLWIKENNAEIIDQEYWQFWDGDYWTVGNHIIPPKKVAVDQKHQISCILLKKN